MAVQGVPSTYRGTKIVLFVADRAVRVLTVDGDLLRELTLDPRRDYQRRSA